MRSRGQPTRRAAAWVGAFLLLAAAPATAGMVEAISYRGLLVLSDGRLVPDDRYELEFAIYDAPTGGNRLFEQTIQTTVRDGLYEVHLSGAPDQPLAAALSGGDRYLDVALLSGGGLELNGFAFSPKCASYIPLPFDSAHSSPGTGDLEPTGPGRVIVPIGIPGVEPQRVPL